MRGDSRGGEGSTGGSWILPRHTHEDRPDGGK